MTAKIGCGQEGGHDACAAFTGNATERVRSFAVEKNKMQHYYETLSSFKTLPALYHFLKSCLSMA
jgi:hypothetical protein